MDGVLEHAVLEFVTVAALVIEVLAVLIIVIAVVAGLGQYVQRAIRARNLVGQRYGAYRTVLGRALLLGLEILVAADIVKTVVLEQTFQSVSVLGMLVLIRVFLGWSLIVEMDGRWPWQKGPAGASEAEL